MTARSKPDRPGGGDEGFLSRWSRRKVEVKTRPVAEPVLPEAAQPPAQRPPAAVAPAPAPAAPATQNKAEPPRAGIAEPAETAPPKPTLADVESLTRDDSFARFVARDVDPDVRNAAMKKLFSDPHYNVMDGLDIYIDDYGKPDPIPLAMLRKMAQSHALGLFDDEKEKDAAAAGSAAPQAPGERLAQAGPQPADAPRDAAVQPPATETPDDEDPDLQLQPDDGDRRAGAGPGTDDKTES
ncbi:DUF3306 domain-containing protein [Piscinibacter sakaiensis]|uniref:DUF3306 domain-containing protein n=1 Tax=Piscinibacter sakaiensis TaxID=1547922 RepID=UPI003AAFADA3